MKGFVSSNGSEIIKQATEKTFSNWNGEPPIVIVMIGDQVHAIADGAGVRVFGSGHLGMDEWWEENGQGAAVKTVTRVMDITGEIRIPGFVHFHRSLTEDFSTAQGVFPGSLMSRAWRFFAENPEEDHAFAHVTFVRTDDERYPWRAVPPASLS